MISVIIPTIGRESLGRAVESTLQQEVPGASVEVVIVNDSGRELTTPGSPPAGPRLAVITTNRRRQSVARNVGAAAARGQYLLFLDDDDQLMPGALAALFSVLVEEPDLIVAYGGVTFVDGARKALGALNLGASGNCASHMLAGALISFGSALIRDDVFWAVGAIDPRLTTGEEVDLFRRLAMVGDFGNTQLVVLQALRGEGWASSQDYGPAVAILRASRERVLDQRPAFVRLARSAQEPYWHGRNVKSYLASSLWNAKARRPAKATSRLLCSVCSALLAGAALLDRDFWQALCDSQVPATTQRALHDAHEAAA